MPCKTCISRSVSSGGCAPEALACAAVVTRCTGVSASAVATAAHRPSCETFLCRKPRAPPEIASATASRSPAPVSMTTRASGCSRTSRRVVSSPPRPGMDTSINTRSGRSDGQRARISSPLSAVSTRSTPGKACTDCRKPSRTMRWSSQIKTVVMSSFVAGCSGQAQLDSSWPVPQLTAQCMCTATPALQLGRVNCVVGRFDLQLHRETVRRCGDSYPSAHLAADRLGNPLDEHTHSRRNVVQCLVTGVYRRAPLTQLRKGGPKAVSQGGRAQLASDPTHLGQGGGGGSAHLCGVGMAQRDERLGNGLVELGRDQCQVGLGVEDGLSCDQRRGQRGQRDE